MYAEIRHYTTRRHERHFSENYYSDVIIFIFTTTFLHILYFLYAKDKEKNHQKDKMKWQHKSVFVVSTQKCFLPLLPNHTEFIATVSISRNQSKNTDDTISDLAIMYRYHYSIMTIYDTCPLNVVPIEWPLSTNGYLNDNSRVFNLKVHTIIDDMDVITGGEVMGNRPLRLFFLDS